MSIPKSYCILSIMLLCCFLTKAQEKDTISRSVWSHNPGVSLYIWKDEIMVLPVYKVDKDWLHLEARYNYEDRNTLSAWVGYNFTGGNKFQYTITPMLGATVGTLFGIAPGL
jgi:hypothetical protein